MYTQHFGLKEKPFSLVPNPASLFLSSRHRLALTYLEYALREHIGIILLTGEIGTGKTTLIRYFLKNLPEDVIGAVVSHTNTSAEALIRLILHELNVQEISEHISGNITILKTYLADMNAQGQRVLLFIDEAQNLDQASLEEIRLLSNISNEKDVLLQIILVGQPEIRRVIHQKDMQHLAQRIPISFHLQPLERDEVETYIQTRLEHAQAGHLDLFDSQAVKLIHEYSSGIPRKINVLCDTSLVYAYADDAPCVTADIVHRVVQDKAEDWEQAQQENPASADESSTPNDSISHIDIYSQLQDIQNEVQQVLEWIKNVTPPGGTPPLEDSQKHELEEKLRLAQLEIERLRALTTQKDQRIEQIQEKARQVIKDRAGKAIEEILRLQELNRKKQLEIDGLKKNFPTFNDS